MGEPLLPLEIGSDGHPPANRRRSHDDAVLRWNACVRMMERIRAEGDDAEDGEDGDMSFDDDVPMR